MKKTIAIVLAAAALLSSVNANAQGDKWIFNHIGVGVSAGLDGFGADIVVPFTPFIQFRGGYAMQPLSYNIEKAAFNPQMSKANGDVWNLDQDIVPSVSANLDAAHLFMDFYLGKRSGLHLTVGAYYGLNAAKGAPYRIGTMEPLTIDDEDKGTVGIEIKRDGAPSDYITTDPEGNLFIDYNLSNPLGNQIGVPDLYPYAGIGFGRNLSRNRIAFTMDLGVIYTGSINLKAYNYMFYDESKPDLGIRETVIHASDLSALKGIDGGKYDNIIDQVSGIYSKVEAVPVTPVLKFNLVFRIF